MVGNICPGIMAEGTGAGAWSVPAGYGGCFVLAARQDFSLPLSAL